MQNFQLLLDFESSKTQKRCFLIMKLMHNDAKNNFLVPDQTAVYTNLGRIPGASDYDWDSK